MEEVVERFWQVFQPLLFGLIGAEVIITSLEITTVCECYSLKLCCHFYKTGFSKRAGIN